MKNLITAVLLIIGFTASAQTHTFVFLHKKSDKKELPKEEVDKIMEGHMANITRLAKEGKLIAAGPFDGGGGIFIFKSTSVPEVKEWLSTDPGVRAERWNVEILPYTPRQGSVCAVSEPYQMVNYHFIHFIPQFSKDNLPDATSTLKAHDEYLKKSTVNVITEAIFGERNGGIFVTTEEPSKDWLAKDPAIAAGILQVDVKKLWIAKGAFCEK